MNDAPTVHGGVQGRGGAADERPRNADRLSVTSPGDRSGCAAATV